MSPTRDRPLALTMGDPAGIGLDISLDVWMNRQTLRTPPFILIGDPAALQQRARVLGHDIVIRETDCAEASASFRIARCRFCQCLRRPVTPG
jgi:4-hydroxythreonine-4-phosphate dehydrogenase